MCRRAAEWANTSAFPLHLRQRNDGRGCGGVTASLPPLSRCAINCRRYFNGRQHIMKFPAFLMLMAVAPFAHGADMYRWVDEKGVVNYTFYPPPPNIRKVEPKKLGDAPRATPAPTDAPYSVQLA